MINEPKLHPDKKSKIYFAVFYDPSKTPKRKWVSLKTKYKDIASKRFRVLVTNVEKGVIDPWAETKQAVIISTSFALTQYLKTKSHLVDNSIKSVKSKLYHNLEPFLELSPNVITTEDIYKIVHNPNRKNSSNREIYAKLNSFFKYLIEEKIIENSPIDKIKPAKQHTKIPLHLSRSEFAKLCAKLNPLYEQVAIFTVFTGLRVGEISRVKLADIRDGYVYVKHSENVTTKSKKERAVPLNDLCIEIIQAYKNQTYLFEVDGKQIPEVDISKAIKDAIIAAKLNNAYTMHTLRHTFASWLLQNGCPIEFVSQWLGHSKIEMTQIYAHLKTDTGHQFIHNLKI